MAASATATRGAAAAASAYGHSGDDSGSDDEAATRLAASATRTPGASAKRLRRQTTFQGRQAMQIQAAAQRRANKAVQEVVAQGGTDAEVAFALRDLARAATRQDEQAVSPAQMTL